MEVVLLREGYDNWSWELRNTWAIHSIAKNHLRHEPIDRMGLLHFESNKRIIWETTKKLLETLNWIKDLWETNMNPYEIMMILFYEYPNLDKVILVWALENWLKEIYKIYSEITEADPSLAEKLNKPLWYINIDIKSLPNKFHNLNKMANNFDKRSESKKLIHA